MKYLLLIIIIINLINLNLIKGQCGEGDSLCDCVTVIGKVNSVQSPTIYKTSPTTGSFTYNYPLNTHAAIAETVARIRVLNISGTFNFASSGGGGGPVRFYLKKGTTKLLLGSVSGCSAPGQYPFTIFLDDFEKYDTYGPELQQSLTSTTCFHSLTSSLSGGPEFQNTLPATVMSTMFYAIIPTINPLDQWTFSVENVPNPSANSVTIDRVPDIRICALPQQTDYLDNWCSTGEPYVDKYYPDECGECRKRGVNRVQESEYFEASLPLVLFQGMVYGTCAGIASNEQAVISQCPCAPFLPTADTSPVEWTFEGVSAESSQEEWSGAPLPGVPKGKGQSVAISENYIMVGSPLAYPDLNNIAYRVGMAQLFVRTVDPPYANLLIYPAESVGGQYGHAVAIDEPNSYVVVTNPMAVTTLSGGDGEVYVYRTNSINLMQTIRITDTGTSQSATVDGFGYRFGESVDVADQMLAIGVSEWNNGNVSNVGYVAVFYLDTVSGLYIFLQNLYPTFLTTFDQFYGFSVALQGDYLVVGTRNNIVYVYYKMAGFYMLISNPVPPGYPPSLVSNYGLTVDIFLPYFSIADKNAIVSPSSRGRVYVFEILNPSDIRLFRVFNDTIHSLNTQFGTGQAISSRNLVVGAPITAPYGAGYLAPFFPSSCLDCMKIFNGHSVFNECGDCEVPYPNGTLLNLGCIGCDGVPNSGLKFDYCQVCDGTNKTCLDIFPSPPELNLYCNAFGVLYLTHEPSANIVNWTITLAPLKGMATINILTGELHYASNYGESGLDTLVVETRDVYGNVENALVVIDIIISCLWCDGTIGATGPTLDICDVCGGDGTSCVDCFGVPGGPAVLDICGVCGGSATTCIVGQVPTNIIASCATPLYIQMSFLPANRNPVMWSLVAPFATKGVVSLNSFANYIKYTTTIANSGTDLVGWQITDLYGNVDTGTITITLEDTLDCLGVECGLAVVDGCGVCQGAGNTCFGCDGVYGSGVFDDACGVCGGDGSACVDCFGVPGGQAMPDHCGVCDGDGSSCPSILGTRDDDYWKWFLVIGIIVGSVTFILKVGLCKSSPERKKRKKLKESNKKRQAIQDKKTLENDSNIDNYV